MSNTLKEKLQSFFSFIELLPKDFDILEFFFNYFAVNLWFGIAPPENIKYSKLDYFPFLKQSTHCAGYPSFGRLTFDSNAFSAILDRFKQVHGLGGAMYDSIKLEFIDSNNTVYATLVLNCLPNNQVAAAYGSFLFPGEKKLTNNLDSIKVFSLFNLKKLNFSSSAKSDAKLKLSIARAESFLDDLNPIGLIWDKFSFVGESAQFFLQTVRNNPIFYVEWLFSNYFELTLSMAAAAFLSLDKQDKFQVLESDLGKQFKTVAPEEIIFKKLEANSTENSHSRFLNVNLTFMSSKDGWEVSVKNVKVLPTLVPLFKNNVFSWQCEDTGFNEQYHCKIAKNAKNMPNKHNKYFLISPQKKFFWARPVEVPYFTKVKALKDSKSMLLNQDKVDWYSKINYVDTPIKCGLFSPASKNFHVSLRTLTKLRFLNLADSADLRLIEQAIRRTFVLV